MSDNVPVSDISWRCTCSDMSEQSHIPSLLLATDDHVAALSIEPATTLFYST